MTINERVIAGFIWRRYTTDNAPGGDSLSTMCTAAKTWLDTVPPEWQASHRIKGKVATVHGSYRQGSGAGSGAGVQGGDYGPMIVYPNTIVSSPASTGITVTGSTTGSVVLGGSLDDQNIGILAQGDCVIHSVDISRCDYGIQNVNNANPTFSECRIADSTAYGIALKNDSYLPVPRTVYLYGADKDAAVSVLPLAVQRELGFGNLTLGFLPWGFEHGLAGTVVRTVPAATAAFYMLQSGRIEIPLEELVDVSQVYGALVNVESNSYCKSVFTGAYTMVGAGPLFTIEGNSGTLIIEDLYVDCAGLGRVLRVGTEGSGLTGSQAEFRNCTIMNSKRPLTGPAADLDPDGGAAMYVHGGSLTLQNCTFDTTEHSSTTKMMKGGFLYIYEADFEITDCVFKNADVSATGYSTSGYYGGAIYTDRCSGASNLIDRCQFENNRSHVGGALALDSSQARVRFSSFVDNRAWNVGEWGGGGHAVFYSFSAGCSLYFESCIFATGIVGEDGTDAGSRGGAIQARPTSSGYYGLTVDMDRCTFYDNRATYGGSAMYARHADSVITVLDSIVSDHPFGSAFRMTSGDFMITYTDFWNNTGGDVTAPITKGDGCFAEDPLYCGV